MSFVPVVPLPGPAGWAFLQRTRDTQQTAFEAQPRIQRNISEFEKRIASITSAEDLVGNRNLMEVALGAFGLDGDINNRFLIEKVLSSDTQDRTSLVNRFADKRYLSLSRAFGFGDAGGARTGDDGFARRIVDAYRNRQFEIAAGEVDPDMRLALGFSRDLAEIASRPSLSNDGMWFTIMSNPPVRKVFESALGLPKSFAAIDLDQQIGEFKSRSRQAFGTDDVKALSASDRSPEIVDKFLVRSQIDAISTVGFSSASIALALLQS
ncbi:DUF1217 domain-containing protein [Palleronia rufa]|uniref:DUF1217 domain-containing protein n=1 Tax=Palleronia rufa TaxID=1530186 RepID=UPI00056BA277|nr:DUF1217 domain-containing protein [Palleronia rufa]